MGYSPAEAQGRLALLPGPLAQSLLSKGLPPSTLGRRDGGSCVGGAASSSRPGVAAAPPVGAEAAPGSGEDDGAGLELTGVTRGSDGVFVWGVAPAAAQPQQQQQQQQDGGVPP